MYTYTFNIIDVRSPRVWHRIGWILGGAGRVLRRSLLLSARPYFDTNSCVTCVRACIVHTYTIRMCVCIYIYIFYTSILNAYSAAVAAAYHLARRRRFIARDHASPTDGPCTRIYLYTQLCTVCVRKNQVALRVAYNYNVCTRVFFCYFFINIWVYMYIYTHYTRMFINIYILYMYL